MNLDTFARYTKEDGHRVFKTESGYWQWYAPFFCIALPEFRPMQPTKREIRRLLFGPSFAGIFYPCFDEPNSHITLLAIDDPSYDLASLMSKARNQTRRGMERTQVRRLSFTELEHGGPSVNLSAISRQKRTHWHPVLTDQALWSQRMRVCAQFEDVQAFGAFVDDKLAAYAITAIVENDGIIQSTMSHSDYLQAYPNNALIFTVVKALFKHGVRRVSFGLVPQDTHLFHFKESMGFSKQRIDCRLFINPILRPFMSLSAKYRHYFGNQP